MEPWAAPWAWRRAAWIARAPSGPQDRGGHAPEGDPLSAHGHPTGRREPVSHVLAGFLAAAAMFAGAIALVWHPGRIGPGAMFVALLAAGMGGLQHRLAAVAVAVTTLCFFFGMVIAVTLERSIF